MNRFMTIICSMLFCTDDKPLWNQFHYSFMSNQKWLYCCGYNTQYHKLAQWNKRTVSTVENLPQHAKQEYSQLLMIECLSCLKLWKAAVLAIYLLTDLGQLPQWTRPTFYFISVAMPAKILPKRAFHAHETRVHTMRFHFQTLFHTFKTFK